VRSSTTPNAVSFVDSPGGIRRWVTCDTRREAQGVLSEKLRQSRRPAPAIDITVSAYLALGDAHRVRHQIAHTRRLQGHVLAPSDPGPRAGEGPSPSPGIKALLPRARLQTLSEQGPHHSRHAPRHAQRSRRRRRDPGAPCGAARAASFAWSSEPASARRRSRRSGASSSRTSSPQPPRRNATGPPLLHDGADRAQARRGTRAPVGGPPFRAREIRVVRGISRGRLDTPKSRPGRTVDVSQQLAHAPAPADRAEDGDVAPRVARAPALGVLHQARHASRHDQRRQGLQAGLEGCRAPAALHAALPGHTFASLLFQQGESPAYVQRSSATRASSSPSTDAGSRWATRPPSIASTTRLRERVVAKW
jgi:hypothetical protein